jgi:choline-sulfatase
MSRPNIILIYCDELRTDALGCYGHERVTMQTPHIDTIAAAGTRFNNCFCNAPVCVPSRTAHLTGMYPEQTGVYHNEAYWPDFKLDRQLLTFPEYFAQHGYATANFGKVHLPREMSPWMLSNEQGGSVGGVNRQEFLEDFGEYDWIIDRNRPWIVLGGGLPAERDFAPNLIMQNALRWLDQIAGPFLLRLSFLQPHTPVLVPKPFDKLYDPARFRDENPQHPGASLYERLLSEQMQLGYLTPQEIQRVQAYYYGLTGWIDAQVGLLIAYLRRSGQWENTIIIFEADHGVSLGENGRYHKLTFAPESHRVPRLISWPGTLPDGVVREDINQSIDLAPTLCDLVGIDKLAQFSGRSLFSAPEPEAIFSTIGYGFPDSYAAPFEQWGRYTDNQGWPRRTCIRTPHYRLDKNVRINGMPVAPDDEDIYLVNTKSDPRERNNLADLPEYAHTAAGLSREIDQHVQDSVEPPHAYTHRNAEAAARHSRFVARLQRKLASQKEPLS